MLAESHCKEPGGLLPRAQDLPTLAVLFKVWCLRMLLFLCLYDRVSFAA